MPDIQIRPAQAKDLIRLVDLAKQLGYEDSPENIARRFEELKSSGHHSLVVAELISASAHTVVGMAYFKKHISLFVEPSLEVGGLVVDKDHRGLGIGRLLMERAEQVAIEWKVRTIRLTSNIKRTEAHRFYLELGFEQPKTSHFFIKSIA
jgi:GNAT superfamily N-acetyltransferase